MTRLALLLMAMMVAPAGAQETAGPTAVPLLQIHHVYLLPMANGFDQHLANHLTRQGLVQVVADPARADAILTDRLGKPFEQRLEELYPEAKPAPGAKAKADEEAEEKGAAGMDLKVTPLERPTSFGRGKGTVFLVHRGSRAVVWSTYERPRRTTPDELDRSARRVTDRLGKAIREAGKPPK